MTDAVGVPFVLFVAMAALAVLALLEHVVLPALRFVASSSAEKLIEEVSARLKIGIRPFQRTKRRVLIDRLLYDPKVQEAARGFAQANKIPMDAAQGIVERYARETVPAFNAYLYFRIGYWIGRRVAQALYRVRLGYVDTEGLAKVDPDATVVFVMNHRSNMDYVLVTWLVSNRASISYAVGEWARIWPFSYFIRAMGAYFIRRGSRNPLYRRVLARYVQMTTAEGIAQAMFPEGGLSLDGRVGAAKLGLLSYIMAGFDLMGRDVVFVPVGLAYDRVLEDGVLTAAAQSKERRFRVNPLKALGFALLVVPRLVFGRFKGFGTAAAGFGAPISLRTFMAAVPDAAPEALGERLMAAIARVVPVVPVPLVAAALQDGAGGRDGVTERTAALVAQLTALGAEIRIAPQGIAATVQEGLAALIARGILTADLRPVAAQRHILQFYAASVQQRLEITPLHDAVKVD